MKPPTRAVPYAFVYPILAELAREKGYSLALHGSMQSDVDVVAIPWTEDACSARELLEHLSKQLGIFQYVDEVADYGTVPDISSPEQKPHGRVAWVIPLQAGMVIDISVMPRVEK
jgi:hypothetical protein